MSINVVETLHICRVEVITDRHLLHGGVGGESKLLCTVLGGGVMAKSAKIQTIIGDFDGFLKLSPAATMFSAPGQFSKLLGYKVKMKRHIKPGDGPQTADSHPSVPEYHSQKDGEIVNVFLDSDGNPKYTLLIGSELFNCYEHLFDVVSTD